MRKFDSSFDKLLKKHYRRDKKSKEAFEGLVANFLDQVYIDPRSVGAERQSFPANSGEEGFELWKKRWRALPGLQGAAKFGRLLYIICEQKRCVYPFWIYTHEEYGEPKNQPSASDLAREIRTVVEQSSETV